MQASTVCARVTSNIVPSQSPYNTLSNLILQIHVTGELTAFINGNNLAIKVIKGTVTQPSDITT
jgi:hypothetical protein